MRCYALVIDIEWVGKKGISDYTFIEFKTEREAFDTITKRINNCEPIDSDEDGMYIIEADWDRRVFEFRSYENDRCTSTNKIILYNEEEFDMLHKTDIDPLMVFALN